MNSSVWVIWAANGIKGKNQLEFFLDTFEGGFFSTFHGQKILSFLLHIVASALKSYIISL